ncbi:ogr/Delta-like zinc finger family protein [Paraburkholderia phenazinium]|jgi:hypothetical protein|uniref:Ogr/Delta-like zinc finger n=1 Tax=Paraburkholderia phenazinium TaxID=60549 RepID=A0A1G8IY73_9BURK|nr:Ogr/Delta-like zinc finger [Paraburkholderia phenazinium]
MRFTIACPLCSTRAIARTSRKLSDTMREITFRCDNDECGHVYIAQLEVVRTIVPSGRYGSHPDIPLSGRSRAAHWQAPHQ